MLKGALKGFLGICLGLLMSLVLLPIILIMLLLFLEIMLISIFKVSIAIVSGIETEIYWIRIEKDLFIIKKRYTNEDDF